MTHACRRPWAWIMLLLPWLAGCSILPQAQTPDVYLLPETPLPAHHDRPALATTLQLLRPQAPQTLQGDRIAVEPRPDVISVYHGARWSDDVPSLLRDRLLDAFHQDGRIDKLATDDSELRADVRLGGALRTFQARYEDGKPVVIIRWDAQLIDAHDLHVLAVRSFAVHQSVQGKAIPQVVKAFGRAADTLVRQVVPWTVAQLQAGRPRLPGHR